MGRRIRRVILKDYFPSLGSVRNYEWELIFTGFFISPVSEYQLFGYDSVG